MVHVEHMNSLKVKSHDWSKKPVTEDEKQPETIGFAEVCELDKKPSTRPYYSNTVVPGKTEQMSTGAQRADATGKGKYVLISPVGMRRLAGVYERGAAAYGANNWKKGMPISRVLDSALRHLYQYIGGDRSEDHLAQAAWNVFAAIEFEETRPDLDDLESFKLVNDEPLVRG